MSKVSTTLTISEKKLLDSFDKPENRNRLQSKLRVVLKKAKLCKKIMTYAKHRSVEFKSGASICVDEGVKTIEEPTEYQSPVTYFDYAEDIYHPLFEVKFIDKYGASLKSNYFLQNNDVIALFFSNSRCKRCNELLPPLKEIHKKAKEQKMRFEIVYIGFDSHKEEMMAWFRAQHGNWYGIVYEDHMKEGLRIMYGILAVPKIIVINTSGNTITRTGVEEVEKFGIDVLVKWLY